MEAHTHSLQEELENVQNRAARFVTGNYVFETGSMTGILGQLKWESLKKRRKDSRLLLYKGPKGQAKIPTYDLIPKNRRCRNQHSLAFRIPSANKEEYKSSFFPQTIRDWNDLPDSVISSAEMSDDCVSKFASLVRARVFSISLLAHPLGEVLSIWRVTSKPFRFRNRNFPLLIYFNTITSRQSKPVQAEKSSFVRIPLGLLIGEKRSSTSTIDHFYDL